MSKSHMILCSLGRISIRVCANFVCKIWLQVGACNVSGNVLLLPGATDVLEVLYSCNTPSISSIDEDCSTFCRTSGDRIVVHFE